MVKQGVIISNERRIQREESSHIVATDGELLMRFARHADQEAFARLVERHGRLVWLVCRQVLRHHQDVEDAFQATFLILAQRVQVIRASDSAAAWLFKVAQRTALATRRRRLRRREESLVQEPPVEEPLPALFDQQMRYVLMEELRSLPVAYQTPILLRYFEGQSRRVIAEQTDSTVGQVQGRLARGKRMLRARLARRGISLSLAIGSLSAAGPVLAAGFTESLAAQTTTHCSAMIAGSAASAATPAVLELVQEGMKAMWYASMSKVAAVVVPLVACVGIALAGQGVGGEGSHADAPQGVTLQASAEGGRESAADAPVTVAAGEADGRKAISQERKDSEDLSRVLAGVAIGLAGQDAEGAKPTAATEQLQKAISEKRKEIERLTRERVEEMAKLEMQKMAKTLTQREVESLHAAIMELKTAARNSLTDEEQTKLDKRLDELDQQFEELTEEFESVTYRVVRSESEVESLQAELTQARELLDAAERADFVVQNRDEQTTRDVLIPSAAASPAVAFHSSAERLGLEVEVAPTTTPVNREAFKQRLKLERDAWLLKAEAFREKSQAKDTLMKRLQGTNSVSATEIAEIRGEILILEADAKLAESKAIEIDGQITAIEVEGKVTGVFQSEPSSTPDGSAARASDSTPKEAEQENSPSSK